MKAILKSTFLLIGGLLASHAAFSQVPGTAGTTNNGASDGNNNTGVGSGALGGPLAIATNALQDTAIGYYALHSENGGAFNTAIGFYALYDNVSGADNTAVGDQALDENKASNNAALGSAALSSNTSGAQNTAVGTFALSSNQTGSNNTASGYDALNVSTGAATRPPGPTR